MKVIIAGSRGIVWLSVIAQAVENSGFNVTAVISGTARGVDQLGERWAAQNHIPVERFPADWNTHGKSAGYKRNQTMAQNADALIAVWDGTSRGTKHMIDIALAKGLKVYIHQPARDTPPLPEFTTGDSS